MNKFKIQIIYTFLFVVSLCFTSFYPNNLYARNKSCALGLVPTPKEVVIGKGNFNLTKPYLIVYSDNLKNCKEVAMNAYFSEILVKNALNDEKKAEQDSKYQKIYFDLSNNASTSNKSYL